MDLSGQRESSNVTDARGGAKGAMALGGGVAGLVVTIIALVAGLNPRDAQQVGQVIGGGGGSREGPGKEDGYKQFSAKVLGSTEDVWAERFKADWRREYQPPQMKLFSDRVDSKGCGVAPSAVGPFYCPVSKSVFLDPTFFEDLERKLGGSKAEFSQAYVIAHEVGHHVQNLTGYNAKLEEYRREGDNAGIRLELQADYLAGVWAYHAKNKLKITEADVKEAIRSAQAIGDNRIQKKTQGWESPEKFTHGTDEQRTRYFLQGFKTGDASKKALDHFFDPGIHPRKL